MSTLMVEKELINKLKSAANTMRKNILRMTNEAGCGHPGGSMSIADIVATLYMHVMNYRPEEPRWNDRDRLVMSKGHAVPAQYAALKEIGALPEIDLLDLRKLGSPLQGHPENQRLDCIEVSSGSLGMGLSAGIGMALARRLDNADYYTYVVMGDGEMQEGQIWEAAMFASHYNVDHLIGIVDKNGLQIDGSTDEVMNIDPLAPKFEAFGWEVFEIDGHNYEEIIDTFNRAKQITGKPVMIIAHTIKGKGVSFMENNVDYHGKAVEKELIADALKELEDAE